MKKHEEIITRFINSQLTNDEQEQFDQLIANDPEFAFEVKIRLDAEAAISYGKGIVYNNHRDSFLSEAEVWENNAKPEKTILLLPIYKQIWFRVACVMLILVVGGLAIYFNTRAPIDTIADKENVMPEDSSVLRKDIVPENETFIVDQNNKDSLTEKDHQPFVADNSKSDKAQEYNMDKFSITSIRNPEIYMASGDPFTKIMPDTGFVFRTAKQIKFSWSSKSRVDFELFDHNMESLILYSDTTPPIHFEKDTTGGFFWIISTNDEKVIRHFFIVN